jgi:very-short-patch-repair endonuclease
MTKEQRRFNQFVTKARAVHGDLYDYRRLWYENRSGWSRLIVEYACNKHKTIYIQRAWTHLQGHGCPVCSPFKSIPVDKICSILGRYDLDYTLEHTFQDLRGSRGGVLRYDIAIFRDGQLVLLIEYDGEHHTQVIEARGGKESHERTKDHDAIKDLYVKTNGLKMVRIPHTQKKNLEEVVTSIMREYNFNPKQQKEIMMNEFNFKTAVKLVLEQNLDDKTTAKILSGFSGFFDASATTSTTSSPIKQSKNSDGLFGKHLATVNTLAEYKTPNDTYTKIPKGMYSERSLKQLCKEQRLYINENKSSVSLFKRSRRTK